MTNNPDGFQREIKIKGQRLEEVENFKYLGAITSNEGPTLEFLSKIAQTTAALFRLKIICRDKNISLASKVKLMRTLILSAAPSFMPVRARPWQQKSREGSKPLRWDAIGDFWTFPTKTMWQTRRFETESRMHFGVHDDLLTMVKTEKNTDGMATSQDPLAWRRQFCRRQWKEREGEEDSRRDGKITSRNGQKWSLEIPWGQRKIGKGGRVERYCCNVICGAPTTSEVKGLRWDEMRWTLGSAVVHIKHTNYPVRVEECNKTENI